MRSMYKYFITFYCRIIFHLLFIHSSADEHLGCLHFLAIMNNAAFNICEQVFAWTYVLISFGTYQGVELMDHMVILCLTFRETARLFPKQ